MARPATHLLSAASGEKLVSILAQVLHHSDHGASNLLIRFVVGSEVALNVAMIALYTQRAREVLHRAKKAITSNIFGQDLEILCFTSTLRRPTGRRRLLGIECQ
jgi:hypothetical protein